MEPAPQLAHPVGLSVSKVVAAAGKDRLQAYIKQISGPGLVALGYYTDENAESWLNIDEFMRHQAQKNSCSTTKSLCHPSRASSQILPPSSPIPRTSSPFPQHPRTSMSSAWPQTSSPTTVLYSDDNDIPAAPLLPPRGTKQVKPDSKEDSDSEWRKTASL
ncbi:hypothetical protein C8R44DRAFT_872866 [Mycena epipterygia]|nr:hypothetical protein C8R44DRAFT_872866 [Mycena epipterygia]